MDIDQSHQGAPRGHPGEAQGAAEWRREVINPLQIQVATLTTQMEQQQAAITQLLQALQERQQPVRPHLVPPPGTTATSSPVPTPVPSPSPAEAIGGGPPPSTHPRSKALPQPSKFNGKRSEYASWASEMREKLILDRHLFQSPREMWYYINACLDDGPRQVVASFKAKGGTDGAYDPEDFLNYLDRIYKDVNEQARAATSLRTMRQREDQPFAAFVPRFERQLAAAGGGQWEDTAKITFLEGALSNQLRATLVTAKLPESYNAWVNEVQSIAWKLEALSSRPKFNSSSRNNNSSGRDADGDVKMGGVNQVRSKRKETRSCYNCGKEGHIAKHCQEKKKKSDPGSQGGRNRVAQVSPDMEADSIAADTSNDESGKE